MFSKRSANVDRFSITLVRLPASFFEFLTQNQLEWRECVPFCTRQSAIAVYDFQVYDSDASWDPDTGLPVRRSGLFAVPTDRRQAGGQRADRRHTHTW